MTDVAPWCYKWMDWIELDGWVSGWGEVKSTNEQRNRIYSQEQDIQREQISLALQSFVTSCCLSRETKITLGCRSSSSYLGLAVSHPWCRDTNWQEDNLSHRRLGKENLKGV